MQCNPKLSLGDDNKQTSDGISLYIRHCSAGTLGRSLHPLGVQEDAQGKEGEEEKETEGK